jgi:hypothetical protein
MFCILGVVKLLGRRYLCKSLLKIILWPVLVPWIVLDNPPDLLLPKLQRDMNARTCRSMLTFPLFLFFFFGEARVFFGAGDDDDDDQQCNW